MRTVHFFLMSQVDPKEQEIYGCWSKIRNYSGLLNQTDDNGYKWHSLVDGVKFEHLLKFKVDWQATMVAYYIRLTKYEPTEVQKQYYDELLDAINQLVGLLIN